MMMRTILHIMLIGIVLTASSGFAISFHFCGDHLVSVFVNSEDEPCCGENSSCCHSETDYLQMDEDGLTPAHLTIDIKLPVELTDNAVQLTADNHQVLAAGSHHWHTAFSPPADCQNTLANLQAYLL